MCFIQEAFLEPGPVSQLAFTGILPPRFVANNLIAYPSWHRESQCPFPVCTMTSVPDSAPSSPTTAIPNVSPHPQRSYTIDLIDHRIDSIRSWRRGRKITHASVQEWELPNNPYHEYVRKLVAAGWTNLQDLDDYLGGQSAGGAVYTQPGLVVSVVDILNLREGGPGLKCWPELHNELDLKSWISGHKRSDEGDDGNVRLYLVESQGSPSPALIETLGAELKLDPRFFRWSIHSSRNGHVFTPSQRHRAPYLSIGFGVLDASTPRKTDAEKFKVLVYIQPDRAGKGWTGKRILPS